MNLSHFKKVSEDEHKAILMHPKGHQLTVAKKPLSAEMKKQLSDLPHYAEGGMTQVDEGDQIAQDAMSAPPRPEYIQMLQEQSQNSTPQLDAVYGDAKARANQALEKFDAGADERAAYEGQQSRIHGMANANRIASAPPQQGVTVASNESAQPVMHNNAGMQPNQDAMPAPDQAMPGSQEPGLTDSYNRQLHGFDLQAQAASQEARAQSKILAQSVADSQKMVQQYQMHSDALMAERKQLIADLPHIDPNHYINSMGTAQRIGTAIGLILGGIGGGLTHQENPAQKFLQDQINRDVESQKSELGRGENLLSANMHQFNDLQSAMSMTRIMQADIVSNKLRQAAANAQDPAAKGRLEVEAGKLEAAYAPQFQQLQMRSFLQKQGANGADPAQFVPYIVPEAHQKEVFNEIKQAQVASGIKDKLLSAFDRASKENTVLRKSVHGWSEPASISEMNALELPMIHDLEGRVNEFEQKTMHDLHPLPGDLDQKIKEKRKAYESFIDQKKSAPTAKAYGIDLDKFASTSNNPLMRLSPQQQQWVQWAKQNPKDPRAVALFQKLGIQ